MMILIVGEDEVFAATLTREFGPRKALHTAAIEVAAQILVEKDVSMLVLVGDAKAFRKLKKHLHDELPTFLIQTADADANEVMAGYKLGVNMVLQRTADLVETLKKFV